MKHILLIVFVLLVSSFSAFAQYTGGSNDGTAIYTALTQNAPPVRIINSIPKFDDAVLWDNTTSSAVEKVKICADGSTATKIWFVNRTDSAIAQIRFGMSSDPNNIFHDSCGYFSNYAISGDTLTAIFHHPQYLSGVAGAYRTDEFVISAGSLVVSNIPIQIYREPVLLVHGLWSEGSSFQSFRQTMRTQYPDLLMYALDYHESHDRSFSYNASVVPNHINSLLTYCRNYGYSAGKVDIIGHSMGGLLSRQYIQSANYRGDVRKLITLNTPHAGTQTANLLRNPIFFMVGIALNWIGKNVDGGAVSDSRGGTAGTAIQDLNDINTQNYSHYMDIASHAVATEQSLYLQEPGWSNRLMQLAALAAGFASVDLFIKSIFFGEQNDLVVPLSSQYGGFSAPTVSLIHNQRHDGSIDNPGVQAQVKTLLDARPDNTMFSHVGFNPPTLVSLYKQSEPDTSSPKQSGTGTVTINAPASNFSVVPGQKITISVSSTGTIDRLSAIEGNDIVGISFTDTLVANADFGYIVPLNAIGRIPVIVAGADAAGLIDYDTLSLQVNITAALDSLNAYPEELAIPERNQFAVDLTGYFHDGGVRNLNFIPGVRYEIADSTIAQYHSKNLILGKQPGNTNRKISYLGDTLRLPVTVFKGDPNFPPTGINPPKTNPIAGVVHPLKVFPNPNGGVFTIQLPTSIGEQVNLEVFNQMGQRVFAQTKKAGGKTLQQIISLADAPAGVYFIHATTATCSYSSKVMLMK